MFRKFLSELFFNTSLGNGFYSDLSSGTFVVLIIFIILSFLLFRFSEYIKVEFLFGLGLLLSSITTINVLRYKPYRKGDNYLGCGQITIDTKDSFDLFLKWSSMMLNDFNDIDRSLVDAKSVYSNLKSIKELENWGDKEWSLSDDNLTYMQKDFIDFFHHM